MSSEINAMGLYHFTQPFFIKKILKMDIKTKLNATKIAKGIINL